VFSPSESAGTRRYLRVNNVAKRLGVPERTVRHWARTGRIRAFRLTSKIWGFLPDDVETLRRQRGLSGEL
jgi:excisionase family DNA binding protein